MAHIGQEFGFGPAGGLGGLLGQGQFGLDPFAFGDVPVAPPASQEKAFGIIDGLAGVGDPDHLARGLDDAEIDLPVTGKLAVHLADMLEPDGPVLGVDDLAHRGPALAQKGLGRIAADGLAGRGNPEVFPVWSTPIFPVIGVISDDPEPFFSVQ